MEAKKDIGKAIRERLDSLDRLPADALWDSISKDLDKNKKRKFPFYWFYIGSFTFIGIAVAAFVISNTTGADLKTIDATPESLQNNSSTVINNETQQNKGRQLNSSGNEDLQNRITTTHNSASSLKKNDGKKNDDASAVNTSVKSSNQHRVTTAKAHQTANNTIKNDRNKKQTARHRGNKRSGSITLTNNSGYSFTQQDGKSGLSSPSEERNKPDNSNSNSKNNNITNSQKVSSEPAVSDKSNTLLNSNAVASQTDATNNSDSPLGNENLSPSIGTKNIGRLKTEGLADSTKTIIDSLKTAVTEKETENKDENEKDSLSPVIFKKFSVFAFAGPSYFSFPERTVVTDSTTSVITTKSTIRLGVLFGYKLNSKLSIRAGISFYSLKQSAKNVKLSYYMETTPTGGAQIVPPPDFTWIDYQQPFGQNSSLIINTLGENYQALINIDRELSYFEVPLEISYNLFDKKFGLDIIGGGSMLILNKNEVFAYNEKGTMYLGKWNAAAKASFTGSLGLGLHYNFSRSLQVNTEPVLNYYFDTYKDSKPYSFSIRVGLQYNFDL